MRCEICKREVLVPEIHHINVNRKDNSINNLLILCIKCHRTIHHPNRTLKNKYNLEELFYLKKYSNLVFKGKIKKEELKDD